MKVSELIQYLKLLPQNADVVSEDCGLYYTEPPVKVEVTDPPPNYLNDCDAVAKNGYCEYGDPRFTNAKWREAVLL